MAGVQHDYLLVVVSLFFTMVFLKKLMIEYPSTFKTKITQGQDMNNNITKTDTLLIAFTDSLWNVGTGIAGSALLT